MGLGLLLAGILSGPVAAQEPSVPRLVVRPMAARPLPAPQASAPSGTSTNSQGWVASDQASPAPVRRDDSVQRTSAQEEGLQWQRRAGTETNSGVELGAPRNAQPARSSGFAPRVAQGNPIDDPFADGSGASSAPSASFASRRYQDEPVEAAPIEAAPMRSVPMDDRAPNNNAFDCDAFYARLQENKLSNIELSVSPTVDPKAKSQEEMQASLESIISKQIPVDWVDRTGRVVAHGRLADWYNGQVIVMDETAGQVSIPFHELSAGSREVVALAWRVPAECLLPENGSVDRLWTCQTYTWTASALCHKPLFFEDVQLERYGQTARPVLQPAISGAHFFLNIAAMPYNAGVYPPNECRYALGYYRPGDCAPYLGRSLPLSARGALFQAGAVTGAAVALP